MSVSIKYLPRALRGTVDRALRTFPVVVITGARQTGKTTFLRHAYGAGFRYVSLEDPDVRAVARADPRGFLAYHAPPVILDEIQLTPDLFSYVKTAVDEDRSPGRWILTGSQTFALMEGIGQSLAGRAAVLHLHGLSRKESAPLPVRSTPQHLLRGSFPEPCINPHVDVGLWMGGYLQTYLERDIRQLAQVADLATFEQFLRLAAARTAQLINHADLARDAAVSPTTSRRWLSLLEASGVFARLLPWTSSRVTRLVKSPKLYALDTGLAAYLTGHRDADTLWNGPMRGAFFESAVHAEIVKAFHEVGEVPSLGFWRARNGTEVDFVIDWGGRLHGVECKANATPVPRMAGNLVRWRELHAERVGKTVLACDVATRGPLAAGVEVLPWGEVGAWCGELMRGE